MKPASFIFQEKKDTRLLLLLPCAAFYRVFLVRNLEIFSHMLEEDIKKMEHFRS